MSYGSTPRDSGGIPISSVYGTGNTFPALAAAPGAYVDSNTNAASAVLVQVAPPQIVQSTNNKSSGSVASLAKAFTSNNTAGNSIIVVCAVGNGTAPTISDTNSNTYTQAAQVANSTSFNVAIFYAVNVASGANTVTVNNGGSTASIAMEIYEVYGLLAASPSVLDQTATNTGNSGTASTSAISTATPNEYFFAGVGVGTAAQTITPATGWTNDSGQQNPTTPAGLYSFMSMSRFHGGINSITPSATFTSEPWAMAVATLRPVLLPVAGTVIANAGTGNFNDASIASTGSGVPASASYLAGNKAGNLTGLTLDSSNNLNVNIAAGAGGGTSSSYGSAFPASGTAAGFSDGTNMQAGHAYDADTGAGTEYVQGVILRKSASGGSVEAGTSSNPLRTDPTGTTTQPVSASSLPLPTGAATSAKQPALGTAGSASSDVITVQGIASMTSLKVDGSAVTQPVSGTVSITSNSAVNVAQVAGTTTDTNSGNKSAGTQRVVLATDQPTLTNAVFDNTSVSATGSAVPSKATLVGGSDGTNTRALTVDGSNNLNVNVAAGATGNTNTDAGTLLTVSASTTTPHTSADQTNTQGKGVIIYFNLTQANAGTSAALHVQGKDTVSGTYYDVLIDAGRTATGLFVLNLYPNAGSATGGVTTYTNTILPRTWRVQVVHANSSNALSYTVGAQVIV